MSKFEDELDDVLVICPYCRVGYQPEGEDYSEDAREEECDECGKKFYSYQSFEVTHHAQPDCELNGEIHNYEPHSLGGNRTHPFCTICGKCQPHSELGLIL